jgi:hypothetical protein
LYRKKCRGLRTQQRALFLSVNRNWAKDVRKSTLSRWLSGLVRRAYEQQAKRRGGRVCPNLGLLGPTRSGPGRHHWRPAAPTSVQSWQRRTGETLMCSSHSTFGTCNARWRMYTRSPAGRQSGRHVRPLIVSFFSFLFTCLLIILLPPTVLRQSCNKYAMV